MLPHFSGARSVADPFLAQAVFLMLQKGPRPSHTPRRFNPVNHLRHVRHLCHRAFATAQTTEDDCLARSPWGEGDLLLWRAPRGLSKRDRVQE